ncbi:hypothetical protein B0H14DRAFT_3788541 [Mycena olivaceomarginata]|nr:hypothetical protein B0H14DRAFT_3788541 [Mycena olivaceomarginata]
MVFSLWRNKTRYPAAQKHLREMTIPCAHELALQDSDRVISSPLLSIRLKTLTIRQLREMLHPQKLIEIMEGLAPFTWGILHTFCASPNASRKRKKAEEDEPMPVGEEDWEDDPNDDPDLESGEADPGSSAGRSWTRDYPGFSRNPIFAILLTISMLAFVRNRATNILPLILGLFFKISGTSSRVVLMLSNAGVCVSSRTVERLKARITEDAIQLAVQLITSGRVFFTIFDNINIFLRKSQQRLSNTNDMINATNCAVNSLLFGVDGQNASPTDIFPTSTDDEIVGKTFIALIAEIIVAFTPGNSGWTDRKNIAGAVADMMPKIVLSLPLPQMRGLLGYLTIWSAIWRIFVGDWLSSNNLRAARRDRTDDIDAMERLEASHMLMRTHYGHAVEDPGSLAAHKGLLNRKWDVSKPNYAAAKSLIRHSLIARILHCVMVINGFTLYSQLSGWQPTLADIQAIALAISTDFATATAAKKAHAAGDDWMAHSIYFIRDSLFFCITGDWHFGAWGQHNYARECAEVLVRWKYELPDKLRRALERAWFVNRWGIIGRSIASDLYLEQLNFWVKRVFIASGSGVTVDYIIRKGSAYRARRSKEVRFHQDIEALVTEMQRRKFHVVSQDQHFVPAPPKKVRKNASQNTRPPEPPRSAIVDVFVKGAEEWNGKFADFIKSTTFDPALGGYPPPSESSTSATMIYMAAKMEYRVH